MSRPLPPKIGFEHARGIWCRRSRAARRTPGGSRDSPPIVYIFAVLGAAPFLELLPYLEELWRGLRATKAKPADRTAG
jgi:hypothetical protein